MFSNGQTESGVGIGYNIYQNNGGLAIPGSSHGFVFAESGGLVTGEKYEGKNCKGCSAYGYRTA
jgi:hypothetical protein